MTHNENVGIFIFLSSENLNEEQISDSLNNSYVQLFVITHIHNYHDFSNGVVIVCVKGRMGRWKRG